MGPERFWLPRRKPRTFVFVRRFRLFTIAQVLVPGTAIVMIGFSATMAAMFLGK